MLHDLGKAEEEIRKRIQGEKGKEEPHAHHGAALVLEDTGRGGPIWPVAFAINGHHAGLHDRHNVDKRRSEHAKAQAAEGRLKGSLHWMDQAWPLDSFGKKLPQWLEELPFIAGRSGILHLRPDADISGIDRMTGGRGHYHVPGGAEHVRHQPH